MTYLDRFPTWAQILLVGLLYVAVYIISTVFFTLANFEILRARIEPDLHYKHGEQGIAAFFSSVILGVFVLGPLTTISLATYMAYKVHTRTKSSKQIEKRKNDFTSTL